MFVASIKSSAHCKNIISIESGDRFLQPAVVTFSVRQRVNLEPQYITIASNYSGRVLLDKTPILVIILMVRRYQ